MVLYLSKVSNTVNYINSLYASSILLLNHIFIKRLVTCLRGQSTFCSADQRPQKFRNILFSVEHFCCCQTKQYRRRARWTVFHQTETAATHLVVQVETVRRYKRQQPFKTLVTLYASLLSSPNTHP